MTTNIILNKPCDIYSLTSMAENRRGVIIYKEGDFLVFYRSAPDYLHSPSRGYGIDGVFKKSDIAYIEYKTN